MNTEHRIPNNEFEISIDDEGDIDLNMFLNIGYHPHIEKEPKKSTFLGVELGYLIVNQGDLFEGTTLNWGLIGLP